MKRISLLVLLAFATPTVAFADDPPPSAKDIEAAKKAFKEGQALYEKKKLIEAAEKFKESYRLSKNAVLLYNIAVTFEEAQMEDLALYYYRKFLADAPADAAKRPDATARVEVLQKKFGGGGTTTDPNANKPDPNANQPDPNANKPDPNAPRPPVQIKPPGTYSASDFQHQLVDVAPPSKPLDVTAFVPEDSGWVVTLHYRTAGEGKFTQKTMKWRYKELVGRIPPTKMIGTAVQYYIEVKEGTNLVTRSGKSTSPNQVLLEAGAPPRFYPDVTDDGESKITEGDIRRGDLEEDPITGKRKLPPPSGGDGVVVQPVVEGPPGNGFLDAGSTKFTYAKWGATGAAGVMLGLSAFAFVQGGKYSSALEDDFKQCGAPPCQKFDDISAGYQDSGKTYNTLHKVTLGVGIAATAVAGYFWYKELRAKKRGEVTISKTQSPETTTWVVVPAAGEGYAGAAAAVRF